MTPEERVWKEELEADIEREKEGGRGLSGTVQAPMEVPRPGEPPLEGSPNPSTIFGFGSAQGYTMVPLEAK